MTKSDLMDAVRSSAAAGGILDQMSRDSLLRQIDARTVVQAGKLLAAQQSTEEGTPRITLAANCTVSNYRSLLTAKLAGLGLRPAITEIPYGSFEASLATGQLISEKAEVVICLLDESHFLPRDWDPADDQALVDHIEKRSVTFREQILAGSSSSPATVVVHTLPLPNEVRDSVLSWRARAKLNRCWCQLNASILELALDSERIVAVDLAGLLANAVVAPRDERLFRYGHLSFSDDALLLHADHVRRYLQARLGLSRKALALDLDNTLWGGVVGEVGAERIELGGLYPGNCYQHLQRSVQRLRSQGIVLTIVSKNDASLVNGVLADHPDMLLRETDFSVAAVNWASKSQNLGSICETLSLSSSAFVFMDDSDFERGEVSSRWPDVALVSASGDPALHVNELLRWGWFDVADLTETDRLRPALYRQRNDRAQFSETFGAGDDYLAALNLRLLARPADRFSMSRVAQLAARTNQFNLTGIRYSAAECAEMVQSPAHVVYAFSVQDRFGDEGIVGAAWADRQPKLWRITNLVLSCRVLGRGIEEAIVAWLTSQARESGAETIEGRFVASSRNKVAADLWTATGFEQISVDTFAFDLSEKSVQGPAWIQISNECEEAA